MSDLTLRLRLFGVWKKELEYALKKHTIFKTKMTNPI